MIPSQTPTTERLETETVRVTVEPKDGDRQPQPWTAPDFTERGVCAEIGAYSFAER